MSTEEKLCYYTFLLHFYIFIFTFSYWILLLHCYIFLLHFFLDLPITFESLMNFIPNKFRSFIQLLFNTAKSRFQFAPDVDKHFNIQNFSDQGEEKIQILRVFLNRKCRKNCFFQKTNYFSSFVLRKEI